MEKSPSAEADGHSASQEILCHVWEAPKLQTRKNCVFKIIIFKHILKKLVHDVMPLFSFKVLHNVNIEIGPGQHVAFVDVSGRVPTPVMDLLLGFYKPSAGKVC
jgi:ABC-type multidrug transport system fused ATPase/permease subunit